MNATATAVNEDKYKQRHNQVRFNTVKAIMVMDRDGYGKMVVTSYDEAMEYARLRLHTEDVVLLDEWNYVIDSAPVYHVSGKLGIAKAEHVNETTSHTGTKVFHVDPRNVTLVVEALRVTTMQEVEAPTCKPAKRLGDGTYLTGTAADPNRFKLEKQGSGRFQSWSLTDKKTGRIYDHQLKKKAVVRINKILHAEAVGNTIGSQLNAWPE